MSDDLDGVGVSRGFESTPMNRALRLLAGESRGVRGEAEAPVALSAVERSKPLRAAASMDVVRELASELDCRAAWSLERVRVAPSASTSEVSDE